jgi:hypothetical protein
MNIPFFGAIRVGATPILLAFAVLCFILFTNWSLNHPPFVFDLTATRINPPVVHVGENPIFHKKVTWERLCPTSAKQFFIKGVAKFPDMLAPHEVSLPSRLGPFEGDRPILLSSKLTPGEWVYRADYYGVCWPWERLWPITGMVVELPFTVVE